MLDVLLQHGADPARERDLLAGLQDEERRIRESAGQGDRAQVVTAEAAIRAALDDAFHFDVAGGADLTVAGRTWRAGRFETVSLGRLRSRLPVSSGAGRLLLWVVDGRSPATDIGSLQARSSARTLFQVASQFNCLEAGGPWIRAVADYFNDSTQGPRASISAFPGTLLRHYRAPDGRGQRFVQTNDGPQVDLLRDVCAGDLARVRSGYLTAQDVLDPAGLARVLESRFEDICVGVHDDVEVVLGYDWDGAVENCPRIAQVFTSTVAGGAYGLLAGDLLNVCRQLLRAAYLGTLLAAVMLGRDRVVLTLIGGGVFGNPHPLIWESMAWALAEVERHLAHDLDVVVNGRNLGSTIAKQTVLDLTRPRGGGLLILSPDGSRRIHR